MELKLNEKPYGLDPNQKCASHQLLKDFLSQLKNITQVVVMGHSMSNVDSDYMEIIEESLKPNQWMISQFNNDPNDSTLSQYSFYSKVKFFSLSNLINKN